MTDDGKARQKESTLRRGVRLHHEFGQAGEVEADLGLKHALLSWDDHSNVPGSLLGSQTI